MRFTCLAAALSVWLSIPAAAFGGPSMAAPENVTVGKNLQVSGSIRLTEAAPVEGLEITLTSDDPSKLLLSKRMDSAGSASIVLSLKGQFIASPEFWLQAVGESGVATYTVTAPGFGSSKGKVSLAPSAIVMLGPFRGPKFSTTTRGEPSRLTLYPVRLDASLKYVEQQLIAGGLSVEASVTSSDERVGKVSPSSVSMTAVTPNATLDFSPSSDGETRLAVVVPPGFTTPAEHAAVTAMVRAPGLAITGQIRIGHNLQLGGVVGLGEASSENVAVTLTSDNPERLLLSETGKEVGSKSITVIIPPGRVNAPYFLQALGKSGAVTYSASANGYVSRAATIELTPSGVVIAPSPYGPPDEAELYRKEATEVPRGFVSDLANPEKMPLLVWTVQLDPVTLRSADITVQPLRAGMSVTVDVKSSNSAVGSVTSPVTINGGSDSGRADFTPLGVGSTVISAVTPDGFTTSSNSTTVSALVRK